MGGIQGLEEIKKPDQAQIMSKWEFVIWTQ